MPENFEESKWQGYPPESGFLRQTVLKDDLEVPIECLICFENIAFNELWGLQLCNHIFHRSCLEQTFKVKINDREFPIKCPLSTCKSQVNALDLREILDNTYLELYNEYSFKQYTEMNADEVSWCPTPDCSYAFIVEKNDSDFNCPKCQRRYCLKCRIEFHIGQTCNEFIISNNFDQNDQLFIDFVQGKKCKQCPKCKFWVEKNEGCDHMTCRCKHEFCYLCGGIHGKCDCKKTVMPNPNYMIPFLNPFERFEMDDLEIPQQPIQKPPIPFLVRPDHKILDQPRKRITILRQPQDELPNQPYPTQQIMQGYVNKNGPQLESYPAQHKQTPLQQYIGFKTDNQTNPQQKDYSNKYNPTQVQVQNYKLPKEQNTIHESQQQQKLPQKYQNQKVLLQPAQSYPLQLQSHAQYQTSQVVQNPQESLNKQRAINEQNILSNVNLKESSQVPIIQQDVVFPITKSRIRILTNVDNSVTNPQIIIDQSQKNNLTHQQNSNETGQQHDNPIIHQQHFNKPSRTQNSNYITQNIPSKQVDLIPFNQPQPVSLSSQNQTVPNQQQIQKQPPIQIIKGTSQPQVPSLQQKEKIQTQILPNN